MPTDGKKGITVKIDAALHAEVRQYLESHEMTMAEFVTLALDNELHPKLNQKEGQNMGNLRTMAFQVPEELFRRIKEYLQRNNMTQKEFMLGLIEDELNREQAECEATEENTTVSDFETDSEEAENNAEEEPENDYSDGSEDEDEESGYGEESEDESETEDMGFSIGM